MDSETLGAALAIAKSIPGTAVGEATKAANRAEAAASSVEKSVQIIENFDNTGIIMADGKLCIKVERG